MFTIFVQTYQLQVLSMDKSIFIHRESTNSSTPPNIKTTIVNEIDRCKYIVVLYKNHYLFIMSLNSISDKKIIQIKKHV